jgi:stage II sporulation protein R
MINWLKKERRILFASFAIAIFFAVGVAASTYVYSAAVQRNIAENVLRFHVVAHSDSPIEQGLKEYVRTEVLANFADLLSESSDIYETREVLHEILSALEDLAQDIVLRTGFSHNVTARIATVFFPTQFYGNFAFPPGYYEAVQIIIGDGAGQNWWCLMFPPLCYVDMTKTEAGKELLYGAVSDESFRILTHQYSDSADVVVRFRVVEWWQNRNA